MKHYDLEVISELMIESIVELFEYFDLDFTDGPRTISFPCPIHGSDSEFSSSILKRDVGNWKCYSAQCHEQYGTSNGASIIQFTQALLSVQYNKEYTFPEAIEWCAKFVGEDATEQTPDSHERIEFIKLVKYINRKKKETPTFTPRKKVREFLAIPSAYYLKRGYTAEILEKFDVGYCNNEKRPFYDRVVTPFYDDSGCYMVGCSGRSRYEQCDRCNLYHAPDVRCPLTKAERLKCYKWKHASLFNADDYLYNYWNAAEHIMQTGTAIVVEGPGDVWRLEEAGIYNSLALLKATLSPGQRMVLESSGAINLVVATDMDEAGNKGARSIYEQCKHLFNTVRIKYDANDPGSLLVEQTKEIFLPVLEKL
jgi:DNA primase